ncbi:MAG TPA: ABC transporter ATP-binding protein [Candidatus Kryptonia bacterium]
MQNRTIIKRILPFAKPHARSFIAAGILTVVSAAIDLATPLVLLLLIDVVIPRKDPVLLSKFGAGFLGLYFLRSLIDFVRGRLLVGFREEVVCTMQKGLYEKIQRLPVAIFDETKTGYLASRILADTTAASTLVGDTVIVALINLIIVSGTVLIAFAINWRLTLIAISVAPVFAIGVQVFNKHIKDVAHKVQEEKSKVYGDVQESFAGIRLIRTFGLEKFRSRTVESGIERNKDLNIRLGVLSSMSVAIALLCTTFAGVSILWYGSYQVIGGMLTLGQLMAFSAYTVNIFGPIRNLIGINLGVQTSLAAAERVFGLMDECAEDRNDADAIDIVFRGNVKFRNVSFSYKPDVPVLRDISFDVRPGDVIALVGESGAGKSTLLSLLSGFYDSYDGGIFIDGIDIKQLKRDTFLKQFGIVMQDTFLFSASVKENIKYGKLEASEEEIVRAAKAANAHEFILRLPMGYDTEVGERGSQLSGGERQRIAIARAILRNPRILILDEATSSVDSRSENLIHDALANLMKGRTTFVIAHRFSTVMSASRIMVIEKGAIIGSGTHEELYVNCLTYRRLFDGQFSSHGDERQTDALLPGQPKVIVNRGAKGERVVTVEL